MFQTLRYTLSFRLSSLLLVSLFLVCSSNGEEKTQSASSSVRLPTLQEVLAAKTDLWGEAALRQPGGPSYQFFAGLLPPLRYVNAQFRHYPIVLSAPQSRYKARLVSNGSAVNARAKLWSWKEIGVPVEFRVGQEGKPFGDDLDRLVGPKYQDGWLPLVSMCYREGDAVYTQESFAPVTAPLADHGVVFLRFGLAEGGRGTVRVAIGADGPLKFADGALLDEKGRVWLQSGSTWRWDAATATLAATLSRDRDAVLAVFADPIEQAPAAALSEDSYTRERRECVRVWQEIIGRTAGLELPEPVVQNAWRALIVGTLMLVQGNDMNYSAGNLYQRMYAEESSSPVHALLFYGLTEKSRSLMEPILNFQLQPELMYHNVAFKLQLLTNYYWLTRDAEYVRKTRSIWQPLLDSIVTGRNKENGLLPKENYCGDIATPVHSLNSNANCWRALRDMTVILAELGEPSAALESTAREYRQAVFEAVAKSESHDVDPPFIPVALFGAERPYDALTASMPGTYWILLSNYLLRSGIFDAQPQKADWIAEYLQRHGGLSMGMMRIHQHSGLFANENGLDDLYTLGYMLYLARCDRPDPLLVTFYGKLAQGLTRDTFIGAEGTGLIPLDRHGRSMYLPPNASGNALWLWTLRYLAVQDFDLNDDGRPEVLRLLPAVPRAWLRDGASVRLQDMPTAFGPVSVNVRSRLNQGEVLADLVLPPRVPDKTLLRLRLPDGWKPGQATAGANRLPLANDGTIDLAGLRGKCRIRLAVEKR